MLKKGDIFEAYCRNFEEIIEVKALDDQTDEDIIGVEFVKGGHWSTASKDNIWSEWETWI
jgi:hypothetical protein